MINGILIYLILPNAPGIVLPVQSSITDNIWTLGLVAMCFSIFLLNKEIRVIVHFELQSDNCCGNIWCLYILINNNDVCENL